MSKYLADSYDAALRENAALSKRLVEAEALLREVVEYTDPGVYAEPAATEAGEVLDRIDAFLAADSASLNMEPCPDGSRVLCVADQPEAAAK